MRRTLRAVICVGVLVILGGTSRHLAAAPSVQNIYVRLEVANALSKAFPDAVADFERDMPALLGRATFFKWMVTKPSRSDLRPDLTITLTFDGRGAVVFRGRLITAEGTVATIKDGEVLDNVTYVLLSSPKRKWRDQKEKNDALAKPLRAKAVDYLATTLHPAVTDAIPIARTVTAIAEKKKVIVPVPYTSVARKVMKGEVQRGAGLDLEELKPLRLEVKGQADDGGAITIVQIDGRNLTPEQWKVFEKTRPSADRIHIDFRAITEWPELLATPEISQ